MAMLPSAVDARALAGLLAGKARELVRGRTVELHVPGDAEIIVEGYVDPGEPPVDPGPLCTSGAHYRLAPPAPVIHVTALTHRVNAILPAMVAGGPPDEACVIHRALHRVFLPLVQRAIPELVDYDLPAFGAARLWAFLSMRKHYAGQARKVAHAAWGMRPLMFAKTLVLVDDEVDVRDPRQVWSAVATHVAPGRDVFFADGPLDPLDPASASGSMARRMAVDATAKMPGEHPGEPPQPATMSEEVCRLVSARWSEYGLGPEPGGDS
jgi:4-hydroxy-3-polyprenylbenzoate decarboxylase